MADGRMHARRLLRRGALAFGVNVALIAVFFYFAFSGQRLYAAIALFVELAYAARPWTLEMVHVEDIDAILAQPPGGRADRSIPTARR